MKETGVFFLYLFGCLVCGALLTYPAVQTGWIEAEPHRVMARLAQVFILLGLWPFLKAMGLDRRAALGFDASRPLFLRAAWRGWLLGLGILLPLAAMLVALEIRVLEPAAHGWLAALLKKAVQALIGGLLVGLLEEAFFRGALYAAIRPRGGVASAAFWTALLYALVHFMKPGALPDGLDFDWSGAWRMFAEVFTRAIGWENLDSLATLFLVGVFLALVRERTGHIGWCIGLHAGWVFVIQVTRQLTDGNAASPHAWLAGDYDGLIGWLAAAWIGVLVLGYARFTRVARGMPSGAAKRAETHPGPIRRRP